MSQLTYLLTYLNQLSCVTIETVLSAVDWTTATVRCMECRKRTLTDYSVCRTSWRGWWHGHPGPLVH